MSTYKFKSNIQCGNCLSKVSPILDTQEGIEKWEVDLKHADRLLTVETDQLSPEDIKQAVGKAGFTAEAIDA